jgi:putative colanic acid biosynthesis acetyltransferase WcaF
MVLKLSTFRNTNFVKGGSKIKWFFWMIVSSIIFKPSWIPFMRIKSWILRKFGAKIGVGFVIKPSVYIKFPWKLEIGNDVWIGENAWIDNLDQVTIGNNVCISQGALLLTGNHDYTLTSFDYRNAPIIIEDGVWIGAKSVVCPGVICKSHSILAVGSVATKNLESYTICQGNPAKEVRKRIFKQ